MKWKMWKWYEWNYGCPKFIHIAKLIVAALHGANKPSARFRCSASQSLCNENIREHCNCVPEVRRLHLWACKCCGRTMFWLDGTVVAHAKLIKLTPKCPKITQVGLLFTCICRLTHEGINVCVCLFVLRRWGMFVHLITYTLWPVHIIKLVIINLDCLQALCKIYELTEIQWKLFFL